MSFFSVIAPIASLASGFLSANAAKRAASAQEAGIEKAVALQREIFNQNRADLTPFRVTGTNALFQLADLFGVPRPVGFVTPDGTTAAASAPAAAPAAQEGGFTLNQLADAISRVPGGHEGDSVPFGVRHDRAVAQLRRNPPPSPAPAQATEPANVLTTPGGGFQESPGFRFRVSEGVKALDRSAAARGLLFSGAQSKALTEFGQNIASEEFNNFANRLAALAGVGQTAVNQGTALGQNFATTTGNLLQNAGLARASGFVGQANAINSGIQNALLGLGRAKLI